MEHLSKHIKKAIETYHVSPEKIKDFIEYINLSNEEIQLIKEVGYKTKEIPDEIISEFYRFLLNFPEIKKILEEKIEILDELKQKHKTYLKQILNGKFDIDYIISRFTIGYVHAKEGIPSNSHIGAYGKYIEEVFKFLKPNIIEEKREKFFTAFFKVILFDLSLSLESYFLKKQEIIEELNQKYKKTLDATNDAILVIDSKTLKILDFNKKLKEMVGLSEEELLKTNAVKITPKILWKEYTKEIEKIKNKKNYFFPHILIENKKTHKLIPCEINASTFEFNGKTYIVAIFRDITKRKSLEGEIERINRLYSVLSKVNLSITRHNSIDEIFEETVKIIVDYGKFKTACISQVDLKNRIIVPKYIYGDTAYFEDIHFPLYDKIFIETISYLEDDIIVIKDINELPEDCKWKERVKVMGFNSAIVSPIYKNLNKNNKDIRWILSIYSDEIRHFEEKEISLVKEISFDLSFAAERIKEKLKFKYLSIYDELTNLPNRNSFLKKLDSFIELNKEKFAVILLDIDKFKAINDTFGYLTGDILLKKISKKLQNLITGKDELARIGSDEFGIILFDIEDKKDLLNFIKNLETEFSNPIKINDSEILVTFSVGISLFPQDGKTTEELISNTEAAMSKAKRFEDYFYFYSQELNEKTHEILELEKNLRLAIKSNEFEIFYQPKIDLKENKIIGAEALLRWRRKNGEIVPPMKFIPTLEETGLINKVGLIVLENVCNQIIKWKEEGIQIDVAVNISAVQLRTEKFLKQFKNLMELKKCVSQFLELEITETALMENIEYVSDVFNQLEEYNIKFSIDDFGTGYSSLVYLKKLPVYALKIDRAFIRDIPYDKDDLTIAKTIIDLATNFNKETIAEGVETKEQLEILKEMGCRIAQGYYFSKPIPAEQFKEFYLNYGSQTNKNSDKKQLN